MKDGNPILALIKLIDDPDEAIFEHVRDKLLSYGSEAIPFLEKLDSYLSENLTIDDILDRILEVGYENITVFEKYYLGNNIEIKEKR